MAKIYTEDQDLWLLENHHKYDSYEKITDDFNTHFGTLKSINAIQQHMYKGIGVHLVTVKNSSHFSEQEDKWLIDNYCRFHDYKNLVIELNRIFGNNRPINSVRERCTKRLKLNGIKSRTSYKKGHRQVQLPIGTIRKTTNGTTYIKVKDSYLSRQKGYREPYWLPIQKKVWQDHYGEVPDGKMVIFLDGNNENIDISNLYCIDRKISAIMASNGWYSSNRDITLTAIKWCELFYAIKCNY
jgi:hypothetical protein